MSKRPPILDVEDDDQRQNRIGTLLERLNASPSSSPVSPNSHNPLLNIRRECLPGPLNHPFELLARIKAFLPAISASNEALSQQKPEDVDIENVAEDEEQYIEMNLGLGVLEAKPGPKPGPRPTSPSSDGESEPTSDSTSSASESDSDSSRSSSEEDSSASASDDSDAESQSDSSVDIMPISSRPIKPLPRAKVEA
ncbi:hypothetical protein J3R82DRAFT_4595 [Butyriboletus roseoflavus]|nr:hypothetical protein J3R82DRAFT_4595 [Butyriboletus roseoflavus]